MAHLELIGISKSFGNRKVLGGVNLAIEEGEFVSIVGSSAAGKTTLVKIASGLMQADSGSVTLNGVPVTDFSRDAAIVFQNYSLLPWLSALENVRLAVESSFPQYSSQQVTAQAMKYLEMVGLGKAAAKKPSQLSGGMRQRVSIARAFAVEPRVLFLDEPFGALDALTRATLQQELARMCTATAKPVTALMITNNVDEAILLSDRIFTLTHAPAATLSPAVPVDVPRPRDSDLLMHNVQAVRVRSALAEFLTSSSSAAGKKDRAARAIAQNVPVEAA